MEGNSTTAEIVEHIQTYSCTQLTRILGETLDIFCCRRTIYPITFKMLRVTRSSVKSPASPLPRNSHQAVTISRGNGQMWVFGGEFTSPRQAVRHYNDLWLLHLNSTHKKFSSSVQRFNLCIFRVSNGMGRSESKKPSFSAVWAPYDRVEKQALHIWRFLRFCLGTSVLQRPPCI